jgi:hypothetical protein
VSDANWLHAPAADDVLVEVEAVDVADAVELEEAELSVSRSSTIAFTSASSSASRVVALDEEELEADDVEDELAEEAPGGGPPGGGPPTACVAELASELVPSWEIRLESSADICTGWEYSVADDELLADDADDEVDCDEALFWSAVSAARRMSRICACWLVPETERLMRKSFAGGE